MIRGNINSIETFGAVDGPGVRYIHFLLALDAVSVLS